MKQFILGLFIVILGCNSQKDEVASTVELGDQYHIIDQDTFDLELRYDYSSPDSIGLINYDELSQVTVDIDSMNVLLTRTLKGLDCPSQTLYVNCLVDETGKVKKSSLVEGNLDEDCKNKLFEIVSTIRFTPGKHDNKPIETMSILRFKI